MLKNYFKIALRNLQRNKVYSFINIAGLGIGLCCAILILLYVKDEVSFDQFHSNINSIYRIVSKSGKQGKERMNGNSGLLQGPRFAKNVPGIKSFVRIQSGSQDIKKGTEIKSQGVIYADSSFFSVFNFPLLSGDAKTCLKEPNSVVLSEDEAKDQFGTTDAIGKLLMLKDDSVFIPYKVTAVAKRCPQNSSIQFTVLLPFKESEADAKNNDNWFNFFLNTFVVLDEHVNPQKVSDQMQRFFVKDATQAYKGMIEQFGDNPDNSMETYFLQSFTDMHLNVELPPQNGLQNASNPMYAYILSGIALFVLLIACINFVNLTIARSIKRSKEIGIRKVVGSNRKQLIFQFLGESFLLCSIAFIFAILLTQLVLPVFSDLANKKLSISYLLDVKLICGYIGLFLLTSLLAGFYPALILSGYKPVETLYRRFNLKGKSYLQKSLVVLQFTLASFLIIGTFTIYAQFDFLTKTDIGYNDTDLILINKERMGHTEAASFKSELLKNPSIIDVAAKNSGQWFTGAKLGNDSAISFNYETIDESFIPELKIPIVQGRNFSKAFPADSNNSILVNEAFVKKAGWKDPIGQMVNFFYNNNEIYHVVGVVKDYHYASLSDTKIGPQLFTMKNDNLYGTFYIKIKPNSATASLKSLQKAFKEWFPLSPYSYVFKNDENFKQYDAVEKWKQIILFGAILTIFISCIGLFGLTVLSAEKRTKEIGIRKVLGASINSIVTTLSKDFLKLVIISLFISIPIGYMAANAWLEKYPYRITLNWNLFLVVSILVITIALLTVSFQSIKAAVANPVKSLRTE